MCETMATLRALFDATYCAMRICERRAASLRPGSDEHRRAMGLVFREEDKFFALTVTMLALMNADDECHRHA